MGVAIRQIIIEICKKKEMTFKEIREYTMIDKGNLSRQLKKGIEAGILLRKDKKYKVNPEYITHYNKLIEIKIKALEREYI